jgi:MFS family permease
MTSFASTPGAMRALVASIVARLPLTMIGIGLLVHAEHLTGSFAAAGLVSGAYAVATGAGGPLLGRLADRRGQLPVLVPSVLATTALLGGAALLPDGAALWLILALATGTGLATPPLAACFRALIPDLLPDAGAARKAYAVDATAVELTWVAGPPLALGLGALLSTGAALAAAGAMLLLGTAVFAAQPATRAWRPAAAAGGEQTGSLRAPGMQTLVAVLLAVGVLFGAVEVAVTAAADTLGGAAAAGQMLGVWGVGSLVGGIVATRRGGGAHGAAGLALVLAGLAAGHLALVAATGSLATLAAGLFVAGAAIAPTCASAYGLVERVTPAGTVTEAFAWLTTAMAVGTAAGAAAAGMLAEGAGPATAFALAGGAGLLAMLVTLARAHTLSDGASLSRPPALAAA